MTDFFDFYFPVYFFDFAYLGYLAYLGYFYFLLVFEGDLDLSLLLLFDLSDLASSPFFLLFELFYPAIMWIYKFKFFITYLSHTTLLYFQSLENYKT
jgi:hypothetical protein